MFSAILSIKLLKCGLMFVLQRLVIWKYWILWGFCITVYKNSAWWDYVVWIPCKNFGMWRIWYVKQKSVVRLGLSSSSFKDFFWVENHSKISIDGRLSTGFDIGRYSEIVPVDRDSYGHWGHFLGRLLLNILHSKTSLEKSYKWRNPVLWSTTLNALIWHSDFPAAKTT